MRDMGSLNGRPPASLHHPDEREVKPGFRVVVARRTFPEILPGRFDPVLVAQEIRTVEAVEDGWTTFRVEGRDGTTHRLRRGSHFPLEAPGGGGGPTLVHSWCEPLPNAPADQIFVLHDALAASRGATFLALVDHVDGDARFSPVCHRLQASEHHYAQTDAPLPVPVGEASIYAPDVTLPASLLPEGCAAGDLLVISDVLMKPIQDAPMEIASCIVRRIASGMTPELLGRWFPEVSERRFSGSPWHGYSHSIGAIWHMETLTSDAISRTQPDEALVLSLPTGPEGRLELHSPSTLGHAAQWETITDHLWNDDLPEGVWLWHDLSWRGTDDGAHLEGEFRRADMDDVARHGFAVDSLDGEIAGMMDQEPGSAPGSAERLLAMQGGPD